jgi:hypothetical protein
LKKNSLKNLLVNFIFVLAAGLLVVVVGFVLADKATKNVTIKISASPSTTAATPKASPSATPKPVISVPEKIQEGLAMLKRSAPLEYVLQKGSSSALIKKQIALAVLNMNTGGVFEKRVWVNEADIKNYSVSGSITVTPDLADEYLDIQPKEWNSFNSYFEIIGHPEMMVVANKYLLLSSSLQSLPERTGKTFTDIVYVPFSPALENNEIISAGKNYLNKIVDEAFQKLSAKNIEALSSPGGFVTSVVNEKFLKNVLLIEHIDPDSYSVAGDNGKALAEKTLTIIGTNQTHAYRYTGSPAGANGLAQFIKSTYDKISSNYPTAGLNGDYYLGMADHVNAVEAMILFFDYYKSDIQKKINIPLTISDEMLVASYNGGTTPVIKSINKYGANWLSAQVNLPDDQRILQPETINYLQKYKSMTALKIF